MLTIKNQANRSILVLVCAMLQDQLQKLLEVLCVGGVRRHHQGLAKTLPTATNTVIVVATWNWGRATS